MIHVTDEQFAEFIDDAIEGLPKVHRNAIDNVAIVYADEPTDTQREAQGLSEFQTLFGLYEGVPLAQRNGGTAFGPDKITIFKLPMEAQSETIEDLKEHVRHTVWHEVAHYFGLDHDQIHALE